MILPGPRPCNPPRARPHRMRTAAGRGAHPRTDTGRASKRAASRGDLPPRWAGSRRHPVGSTGPASGAGGAAGLRQPPPPGHTAPVIGGGPGDDAQQVSRRGYRVTACDLSPTAIDRCRERFRGSAVDDRVADLLALPCRWQTVFDLVVEIRTLQSLSPSQHADAAPAMARTVRPGGRVFVRCLAGTTTNRRPRPWPLSRREWQPSPTPAHTRSSRSTSQPSPPGAGPSPPLSEALTIGERVDRAELVTFPRRRGPAVLATRGPGGTPEAAPVGAGGHTPRGDHPRHLDARPEVSQHPGLPTGRRRDRLR
jgi:hypothetical protein